MAKIKNPISSLEIRYDAKPFAFRFTTRGRGPEDLDSRVIAQSPMTFVGGKIEKAEEIEARNDPKEKMLRLNLRFNEIDRVFVTTEGWKVVVSFGPDDVHVPKPELS